jgi:hypothetical protein
MFWFTAEIRVLVGAHADALAACKHRLGLQQVRQPALARQVADPATERQPADSRDGDDPAGRRESVLVGGTVDLAPGAATADPHRARLRVDLDLPERRQVDDDAFIAGAEPGAVVAAPAHGEEQVPLVRKRDDACDVVRPGTARNQRRAPADHRVVDLAGLFIPRVTGPYQLSGESARELAASSLRRRGYRAHAVSFRGSRCSDPWA